jgi:DNA-binding PadR family transcriptional regulator
MFEKGDLKYVFLDLLSEKPRHGYDLIRAVEERFQGRYTASPGTVYPILQMLEDMGLVSVQAQDGRKVYSVTEAGRQFLAEHQQTVQDIWTRAHGVCGLSAGDAWQEAMLALRDLAFLLGRGARGMRIDDVKAARLRDAILQARREIEGILGED